MTHDQYAEVRTILLAQQVILVALLSTHQDKELLASHLHQANSQMKVALLSSNLDDRLLALFDEHLKSTLQKAGLKVADD